MLTQEVKPLRVAILQSNYIPWKGYFDIINDVDLFVFYDDVQYTKNDWRNRNKVKISTGTNWLTVPVGPSRDRLICDVRITDQRWQKKHWETLWHCYGKAPFFSVHAPFFKDFYLSQSWTSLSELNQYLIKHISRKVLASETKFIDSREFMAEGSKQNRLLNILRKAGATQYISGPAAKNYIEEEQFISAGIELIWKDYSNYPEYPQFHPPFEHGVTILDLLFHTGPDAPYYIWGWRESGC
ncbi:MAG: WbqC family protein [Chromatiaceae bacterium]|nr:WbqC family protein [Gammaproteobacteria bacterium]MCP5428277.1 WbqC family protein [Chromatiaceae bacterium]MCP5448797.1 WbqC family protein [Chromatiaceae bacterium]